MGRPLSGEPGEPGNAHPGGRRWNGETNTHGCLPNVCLPVCPSVRLPIRPSRVIWVFGLGMMVFQRNVGRC